jgi:hypothetical protein
VSCCCEKLVAEAWNSWGTPAVGSGYQATASEDMPEHACVRVCVCVCV